METAFADAYNNRKKCAFSLIVIDTEINLTIVQTSIGFARSKVKLAVGSIEALCTKTRVC